jgi:hypothetical protein
MIEVESGQIRDVEHGRGDGAARLRRELPVSSWQLAVVWLGQARKVEKRSGDSTKDVGGEGLGFVVVNQVGRGHLHGLTAIFA